MLGLDGIAQLSSALDKLKEIDESKLQSFVGGLFGQFLATLTIRAATSRPVPEGYMQTMRGNGYDDEAARNLYAFVLEHAIKQEAGETLTALQGGT